MFYYQNDVLYIFSIKTTSFCEDFKKIIKSKNFEKSIRSKVDRFEIYPIDFGPISISKIKNLNFFYLVWF